MLCSFLRSPKTNATSALALLAVLGSAAAVRAQVGTGRVGVKPLPGAEVMVKSEPLTIGKVRSAQPAPVETVRVGALLAIAQIAQKQLTPQQAWEQGLLNANDILQLLSRPERLTQDGSNEDLKRDLAGLLVRYAPTTVATPEQLSARVRLELCHYYSEQGDERVVPLCEALIAEKLDGKQTQMPTGAAAEPDNVSLWLGGVIYLAQYYEKVGQWQKAAETWERALAFWQDVDWWQAGVRIDAARAYSSAGQYQQSEKLYAEAARSSLGISASGAIIEWLGAKLPHNSHDAELHLLQIEKEASSVDAKLASRFLLAKVRYQSQDWDGFLQRAQQVTEEYDQSEKSRRSWFFDLETQLEELKKWAKLWQKQDLVIENSDLQITLDSPLQQPLERRIFVDSAVPTELKVAVEGDKNRINVRVEPSPWSAELEGVRHQQIVVVVITPGADQVKATIQISKATQPSQIKSLNVEVTRVATANIATQGET